MRLSKLESKELLAGRRYYFPYKVKYSDVVKEGERKMNEVVSFPEKIVDSYQHNGGISRRAYRKCKNLVQEKRETKRMRYGISELDASVARSIGETSIEMGAQALSLQEIA